MTPRLLIFLGSLFFGTAAPALAAETKTPANGAHATLGAHALWAVGKVVPGVTFRAGDGLWWATVEASFLFLTDPPSEQSSVLGNQLGGYFMVRPLDAARVELEGGLGLDYYPLWAIHADAWELALSLRAAGHVRVLSDFGLFATARVYPLSTNGLELGVRRDGDRGPPVMFGTGVEWWIP